MCGLTGANANQNVAVGSTALCAFTTGLSNDAIGALALVSFQSGCYNVSVGGYSSFCYITGNFSTAVGHRALNLATGCCNTSLGAFAGENITTGCGNVAIGPYSHVPNPAGNNQLAIGYASGANWLTGDSSKNIRPGAGVVDCTGSVGTFAQPLTSTGTALLWTNNGKMASGFANDVGVTNQWIELDGIQFGMWSGACRSFVIRPASGTLTASWSTCWQGGTVGFGSVSYQDIAVASPNWRFLAVNANFPAHASVQQATICLAASGGFSRSMYQFCGMVGSGYINNVLSVTRIA